MKLFSVSLLFFLTTVVGGVEHEETANAVAPEHRILQAGVADCVWDGASCSLRRDFVRGLPGVLGSPTTDSAKLLADAALRAAVCSNFTGKPECLAGASYNCDWDTVLNRCTLVDLLNATMLRGLAYCPGSRLDVAMSCMVRPASGCDSTSGASGDLNCTLVDGLPLQLPTSLSASSGSSSVGGGFAGLDAAFGGDRQISTMMGSMLTTMVKYGMAGAADPISQLISGLLSAASATAPTVKVCVASWLTDSATVGSLSGLLQDAITADRDLLSAVLGSSGLAGSCNGTLPLLAAATACQNATSGGAAACAAKSGCQWLAAAGACTLGPDALPALTLDPSDRWVTVLNNATTICRSFTDAGSCGAAVNIAAGLQRSVSGSGGGGGAAGAPAASWWLLATAAAAAVALMGETTRRG